MKRFANILLALLTLSACSQNRESIVKVYNWSNYIDEDVIPLFEEWYEEQTGEKVKVIYQTFDINETMLSKIERGKEDYDVVCPSDYIIERMLNGGLLVPLDFSSLPDNINYIKNNQSPYMREMFRKINPDIDANDYSVAFMWGTTGILYNASRVTEEEASSWDVLRNPKFAGRIFIKDAPRDVFCPVLIYLRHKDIENGKITIDELSRVSSDEAVAEVEAFMKQVAPLVAGWEADFGKEQMTQERGYISLNWSGDAVWAIEEAGEVGVDLRYVIPKEGSNVWFDGWVIPKYARNIKAATYFIDFMCRPDISIRNMEVTGYVSANGNVSVLESQMDDSYDPVDLSYFFPGADNVRVNPVLYPDAAAISRCGMEHDWGKDTDKLIEMWARVKGENANAMTFIVIAAVIVLSLAVGLKKKFFGKKSRRKSR